MSQQIHKDGEQNRGRQGLEEGVGDLSSNGDRVSVGDDEKVLGIDAGDGY